MILMTGGYRLMSLGIFRVMTMALSGYTTRVIRGTLVMMMMTFTLTLDARPGVDPWFLDESGTPRYSYDHVIESEQSDTESFGEYVGKLILG